LAVHRVNQKKENKQKKNIGHYKGDIAAGKGMKRFVSNDFMLFSYFICF